MQATCWELLWHAGNTAHPGDHPCQQVAQPARSRVTELPQLGLVVSLHSLQCMHHTAHSTLGMATVAITAAGTSILSHLATCSHLPTLVLFHVQKWFDKFFCGFQNCGQSSKIATYSQPAIETAGTSSTLPLPAVHPCACEAEPCHRITPLQVSGTQALSTSIATPSAWRQGPLTHLHDKRPPIPLGHRRHCLKPVSDSV